MFTSLTKLDWKRTKFVEHALDITAQVSSRILLGAPLCRDPAWIRIAKEYTIEVMTVAFLMSLSPGPLRPLVHQFLPAKKNLLKTVEEAEKMIQPEVDIRRKVWLANSRAATAPKLKEEPRLGPRSWPEARRSPSTWMPLIGSSRFQRNAVKNTILLGSSLPSPSPPLILRQ